MSQYDYTILKLAKMVSEIIARRHKISKYRSLCALHEIRNRKDAF